MNLKKQLHLASTINSMGASASRDKFRESFEELIGEDISPDDAEFWDELWKIPSSAEEVFELISPTAARYLRDERFDNLATLFTQATAQLCQIVETPYSIYFDQALNCVRVLTRVLPFLLEKGDLGEADINVESLCWGTGEGEDAATFRDSMVGKIIGGDDKYTLARTAAEDDEAPEPLALLAIHAAMHMLFLPQFTCDFYEDEANDDDSLSSSESRDKKEEEAGFLARRRMEAEKEEEAKQAKVDNAMKNEAGLKKTKYAANGILLLPKPACIVWAGGCGVKSKKHSESNTRKFDKNRVEVLRLLLAACCDPLYSPAEDYNPLASRWLSVATAADAPNAICLFYSLLNTIITYDPKQGISGAFAADTHARVVGLSAQILCVLLDCGLSGNPETVRNDDNEDVVDFEEAAKTGFNIFRTTLARIDNGKELSLIYDGLTRLLWNVHESGNNLMPGSSKGIQCYQEVLVLFWKMLDENPLFMNHILTKCDITKIVVPICYILYQSRKDPTRIGLVHICTFLLLKLSGERSFAVGLNKPYDTRLPCDLPLFTGGHADLISITFHKLVVNGCIKLVPLYSCFLTIICNISPYWRKMSLVGAVKLVNLFELLASPKFLFSDYKAYQHLAQLLEIFNNIIQYQYHDNQHLVYAIIRRKDTFGKLATMSLTRATALYANAYGDEVNRAKDETRKRIVSVKHVDEDGIDIRADDSEDEDDILSKHFEPTESWLSEFKDKMPFETLTRLLQHLVPVIDDVIARVDGVVDEGVILDVLKDVTMVGLLPVPHPIVIRKYQPNQYTALWFTAYLWGVIYVNHQSLPIFDGKAIKLFRVSVDGTEEDEDDEEEEEEYD